MHVNHMINKYNILIGNYYFCKYNIDNFATFDHLSRQP